MASALHCSSYDPKSFIDATSIELHPFHSMMYTLMTMYDPIKTKPHIDAFYNKYSQYADYSMSEILSFETDTKVDGITTIQISYDNGQQAIESMIEEFRNLCNQLKHY